jgi:hypothetical protein
MTAIDAPFSPLSLEAFFALELPEIEFVVEEILPAESACLLDGREKSGKGLLSLDLCASVALGEPFLDRAVNEGPAIYCAAEEHLRDVRSRVAARLGNRRDAPLYILPLDGSTEDRLQLEDPIGMQRLLGMIEELQPVVVVLDTLRELHSCREDLSDEMGPLLRPVRQLAHQTGTTIVVNHHQNKGGGYRGSTAIRAAFDLQWAFTRTDDEEERAPRGTLRVEGRHGPRSIFKLRLGEGLHWELDETVLLPTDPGARERILVHLTAVNTSQTAEETATETNLKLKTVQNVLAGMMKEIPRPFAVKGTGAKNNPRQYGTLAPRSDQLLAEELGKMIPPDRFLIGRNDGGNQFGGANGEAGND